MAAGQMPGLVREHADDLVRRLRLKDRTVIDEDAATIGDERVERALVDDHHLDVLLLQTGDAQDRARVFAQELLGLGVAQHRRPLHLRLRGRQRQQRNRSRRDEGGENGGLLAQCDLEQHQAVWVKRTCSSSLGQAFLVKELRDWSIGGGPDTRYALVRLTPYEPYNAASLGRKRPFPDRTDQSASE
ncbi:hypothetical protein ACVW0I_003907 [Bradyrhizobium sp. LM6.11]